MANLHQLLKLMVEKGASDLHITAGSPPQLRIDGHLVPLKTPPLAREETQQLCYAFLTESQKHAFEEHNELDLSFGVKGLCRFRANVYMQKGCVAGAFRVIPSKIHSFTELGLPDVVATFTERNNGLVLVTGPTGSGKSTTLAAMVDKINQEHHHHILTIEDPIEYLHNHKSSIVNQREVGADTSNFKTALRYVLRQDPDVVLVGEMRDLETVEAALQISETGHLCMATLHTNSAVQSIHRIIDLFPPHQHGQVRAQLSFVMEGIVSQQLIPKASGAGRVMACEILVPTPAIRNLIREDKMHQVYSQMQVGQKKYFMQTMNQALYELYSTGQITLEDALINSNDLDELRSIIAAGR
ncbi:PilT/PilU family type 4a pilus ATPase [Myxococcota bacterium]|nr:PilT/PilU family type 4a pilus ATPase [Myxococcota bacterium]MBU1432621.1 PilT/PilU family type 4a pilus ATPase [Myxococcota bacterium]MBU1899516.1 PilT/PilU family type 4a pilus ATPase [Myxococcota bacterium]